MFTASDAMGFAQSHPVTTAAVVGGTTVLLAPGLVAGPGLAALGFTSNGVAAGSVAAGVQSGIGSVAAPGLFATLQSAGASGYGLAAVHSGVQAAAGSMAGAAGVGAWWRGRPEKRDGEEAEQHAPDAKNATVQDQEGKEDEHLEDGSNEGLAGWRMNGFLAKL